MEPSKSFAISIGNLMLSLVHNWLPMDEFHNWLESNSLIHITPRGLEFSWSNGRRESINTQRTLDRSVCNHLWLYMCCSLSCSTLTQHKSDHFPLLLEFQVTSVTFASQFKFQQMWTLHSDCKEIVNSCWNTNFLGSPMYIMSSKLKLLKDRLKVWNRNFWRCLCSSQPCRRQVESDSK